jgi:hypothetical protein
VHRCAVLAVAAALAAAGCAARAVPDRVVTRTETVAATPAAGPVPMGATTVRAGACPFLRTSSAADAVGMRLGRTEVLVNRSRVTGCRFYAVQHSALHTTERLPGPRQPVIAITSTRYRSADGARARVVALATRTASTRRTGAGIGPAHSPSERPWCECRPW